MGVNGQDLSWMVWVQTHELGPNLGRIRVHKENN